MTAASSNGRASATYLHAHAVPDFAWHALLAGLAGQRDTTRQRLRRKALTTAVSPSIIAGDDTASAEVGDARWHFPLSTSMRSARPWATDFQIFAYRINTGRPSTCTWLAQDGKRSSHSSAVLAGDHTARRSSSSCRKPRPTSKKITSPSSRLATTPSIHSPLLPKSTASPIRCCRTTAASSFGK